MTRRPSFLAQREVEPGVDQRWSSASGTPDGEPMPAAKATVGRQIVERMLPCCRDMGHDLHGAPLHHRRRDTNGGITDIFVCAPA
ncbi:MAG: hypothetical protein R3D01_05395 [Hyphomicrobiales bacterium]